MSGAGGNNKAGSCNKYEQKKLENIERNKRRLTALNIPAIVKSMEPQGQPKKTLKKKHNKSISATKPPNLRPRPQRKNAQHEEELADFLSDNVEGIQNDDPSNGTIKKRTGRGITKMDGIFSRTPDMPKIKILLNDRCQPIGKSARLLGVKLERKYRLLLQIGDLLMVKRSMSCGPI